MLARKHKVSSRVICTSSFWVSNDYGFFKQVVSAGAWCLTQKNIHIQSLDIKATCPTSWKLKVGETFLSGHYEWQRLSWNRQKYIWRAPLIHSSFLENAWTCWLDLTCLPLSMLILLIGGFVVPHPPLFTFLAMSKILVCQLKISNFTS